MVIAVAGRLPDLRDHTPGEIEVGHTTDGRVTLSVKQGKPGEIHLVIRPKVAWALSSDLQRAAQTAERIARSG